jgi:hypothetical protein
MVSLRLAPALVALLLIGTPPPAAAVDPHVLYGFKLGQQLQLVRGELGEPAKVVPFEDGWKAYVWERPPDHAVVFETDASRPDVIIAIQLEGKKNPRGMGLEGIDLGTDAKLALEKLGPPTVRETAVDEETNEKIPDTWIDRWGERVSIEERHGKVSSIKVLLSGPSEAPAFPDLEAFLRDVREKRLVRLAEAISSDLELRGEKVVHGSMLRELSGKTPLADFLFGKDGVASLSASAAVTNLRVIAAENGGPAVSGTVFKFDGKKVHELFFIRSFEGWVLYQAW